MSEDDPELIKVIDGMFDSLALLIGERKYKLFRDSIIKEISSFEKIPTPLELGNIISKVFIELVNSGSFKINDVDQYYDWVNRTLTATKHEIEAIDDPESKIALSLLSNLGTDLVKNDWDKIKQHEATKEGSDARLTKLSQSLYNCGFIAEPLSFAQAMQNTGKCDWQKDVRLLDFLLYHITKNQTERNKGFAVIIANRFLKKGKSLTVEKVKNNLSHKTDKDYHLRTQSSGQQVILDLISESKINESP